MSAPAAFPEVEATRAIRKLIRSHSDQATIDIKSVARTVRKALEETHEISFKTKKKQIRALVETMCVRLKMRRSLRAVSACEEPAAGYYKSLTKVEGSVNNPTNTMLCSLCKLSGHNKNSCPTMKTVVESTIIVTPITRPTTQISTQIQGLTVSVMGPVTPTHSVDIKPPPPPPPPQISRLTTAERIDTHPITPTVPVPKISDELRIRFRENFAKCVKGYHLVNDNPIKEAPWEDINAIVLTSSGCAVKSQSNGSHKSGGDLSCSLGDFSNKSTQYESGNNSFNISSYRLTTVCSEKTPGKIEDIIAEINKRKNFKFYSIIVRKDTEKQILYEWYLIPSDCPELNPAAYTWHPTLGKVGKNKGAITGWKTETLNCSSMTITFSMSSQLWIYVNITEEMRKFVVGSCSVNSGRKYNYIQLYERECVTTFV